MKNIKNNTRATGAAFGIAAFLCVCGYFAFAAIQGEFGHLKRVEIESEGHYLELQLADLREERQIIENKTKRMSDGFLDLDTLDEQARKVLGMARPNEIIIR
jgi:cell division protein FtsB